MRILTVLGCVFLHSLLSTIQCDGELTAGPTNTAALIGTVEQLNCSATVGTDVLVWSIYDETTPAIPVRIYQTPNTSVYPAYADRYEISISGNEYNLIIKQVDPIVATTYTCELLVAHSFKTADLVAVEELQCPQSGIEVVEGIESFLTCNVVFHTAQTSSNLLPSLTPSLTWSSDANLTNSVQTPGSNTSYMQNVLNVTLYGQDDATNFTCDMQFVGANAPEYTASCVTTVFVLHRVSDIFVDPSITEGQEVEVGTVFTCTTNGRPAPTIGWFLPNDTNSVVEGENLTVTADMIGQGPLTFLCQANNTVENLTYFVETNITFVAVDVSSVPVSTHGVETWVIVVSVVVPVVVLAASGVAAFFIWRHYDKKKKSKKPKTNGSSASAATTTFTAMESVESQPFLYSPNQPPQPSIRNGVSYQPNGSQAIPGATPGFADLGGSRGEGSVAGSQYGGSTSRIATPNPTSYPYNGPPPANGVGVGPGSVVGGRGTPAVTAGPQLAAYAGSTGRLTPATDMSSRPNPTAYPYTGPARQTSNASSVSSYHGGSQQNMQAPPLSYPPARPGSSHNSSLV